MKICLKCECIYPDYHVECPVCKETNCKEWKKSDRIFSSTTDNKETLINEIREPITTEYHYDDLKDFLEN